MEISIRSATPNDHAALWSILEPIFRDGDTYTVDPDINREAALAYWAAPGNLVFVAEHAGTVLGTFYIKRNQGGGGAHVCNCGFATDRAAQGQGVGRKMLAQCLVEASKAGFRAMQFNFVVATNTRAVSIWQEAGFQIVGRLPGAFHHPAQGDVDALVMYKNLDTNI